MVRDTSDYEASEKAAIDSGKSALERIPWAFNRKYPGFDGFFSELRINPVNPYFLEAHCVDGNGTKLFYSAWSDDYRKAPIDGIQMNANDLAPLMQVYPDSLNIYIASQTWVEENKMDEIMNGFADALERIRIPDSPWDLNIGKIETASLDEMISLGLPGKGVDFGVSMTGLIHRERVPNLNPKPGDVIVGVASTGMHSNGHTGARHKLLAYDPEIESRQEWADQYTGRFGINDTPNILERKSVLEALKVPTADYLVESVLIGRHFDNKEIYGINITGNGLHNFNRAGEDVSFEITNPLEPHPIHKLLMQESKWDTKTAYTKQNMGMGFAYIAPSQEIAEEIVNFINDRGQNRAHIVGEVRRNKSGLVTRLHIPDSETPVEFIGYAA